MNIPMPTEDEKNKSVQSILTQGIKTPCNIFHFYPDIYKSLGIKFLLFGVTDCIFLAFVCTVVITIMVTGFKPASISPYSQVIFISPFFYIFSYRISEWKERQMGTSQLIIACKYTLKHLTAFRMLYFGGMGALLNILICLGIHQFSNTNLNFFKLLLVSFCSLILYSVVYLVLVNFNTANIISLQGQKWNLYNWMPALWCIGNVWLFWIFNKEVEEYLLNLSFGLGILVLIILTVLYLFQIQLFLMNSRKEDKAYVNG